MQRITYEGVMKKEWMNAGGGARIVARILVVEASFGVVLGEVVKMR